MEYFWKENKKFVLAVGGGAVFLLVYWMFLISPFRASAAASARQRQSDRKEYEGLIAQGVPAKDAVAAAVLDRDELQKGLSALVKDTVFKPGDRFRKPEREAKGHYEDLRIKVEKELKETAAKAKIDFPGGLGMNDDVREDLLPELLLRLAAVDRLVSQAIAAGVEKIETVDGMAGLEESGKKGAFLNAYAVFLKVKCSSKSALQIVHGVQRKGNYLAVTRFAFAQEDPARDFGTATITAAVLRVDEKAPLVPKAEERP